MAATNGMASAKEIDLQEGLDDLRRSVLSAFLPFMLITTWIWFAYVVVRGWKPGLNDIPFVISLVATYLAYTLREKHYTVACWAFLLSLILIVGLVVLAHPAPMAMVFGVLVVVAANALLGVWAGGLAAALAWGVGVLALYVGTGTVGEIGRSPFLTVLVLYCLTLATSWLTARPLRTSVEWALTGWGQAHKSLDEVQARRGELYRALRALEEATYRIERMNNELIVAQREAEEARALKARFAATVSHELRGPLNLVLGFTKLMALSPESYGEPLPRAYRADVDATYRNAQHLVALVDDILDLSQIEAQRLPLVKDRIDLEVDVIGKVVRIVQPLAERKGLALHQKLAGNLPWILADPVRLRQALLNLLINAVRFTERGRITVSSARQGDELLVSVQDTGAGIAAQDMPRLFKEFHQVHRQDEGKGKGSGLGLAISKHLIELHEGKIWAESVEGVGTTFYFTVPLPGAGSVQPASGHLSASSDEPRRPTAPESCLIVHDDPSVVRLLARYVEDLCVVGLPNAQDVARLTEELHPSAILTGPDLVGLIEEQLRETPYDVPVISCEMPRMAEQAQFEGIISYLIKPIMSETLVAVMAKVEREGETKVLLVDDDPDAVRLLERMLMTLPRPYTIYKAYDGSQALDLMQEVVPDVVLMDLVMSELDGRGTIERMRADERLRQVPVIIVSARGWIEENAVLGTTISVRCREPIDITRGARCLGTLLSALSARYVGEALS